jgi:hypothetical protein
MASFRRGAEAISAAATRPTGGNFTPTFKFEADKVKYLQFITGIEDIPTVLMHRFVIVGQREDGGEIYENFISRRDPALDGPEGYDPIIDRFGYQPSQRCIAIAVELEPILSGPAGKKKITGWEVAKRQYETKEEGTQEVPNVALIIESPYTFFSHLTAIADMGQELTDAVFAVKRTGKKTDTSYTFLKVDEAIDVEEEIADFLDEFNFEAYLEDLADEDKMHEHIDPLGDNAVISKYPPKGGKGKKEEKTSSRSTSTRTRRAPAEEAEPDEPDEGDAEPEAEVAEPATPGRRSRSFSELKRDRSRAS